MNSVIGDAAGDCASVCHPDKSDVHRMMGLINGSAGKLTVVSAAKDVD
jgi:hypothetical protein